MFDTLIYYIISQKLRTNLEDCTFSTDVSFCYDKFDRREFFYYLKSKIAEKNKPLSKYISRIKDPLYSIYHTAITHIDESYANNISIIDIHNPLYPSNLKHMYCAPKILNIKGNYQALEHSRYISIIGSRDINLRAKKDSFDCARLLSNMNYTVVSGGAIGCDETAHHGAMSSDYSYFPTVAVLAGGLSNLYPRKNYNLFEKILEKGGVLLSENMHSYLMKPYDFPIRNRIISGLSSHTILIRGRKKSGSFNTCMTALDQGREVLVYNTESDWFLNEASSELLDSGATLLSNKEQLYKYFLLN